MTYRKLLNNAEEIIEKYKMLNRNRKILKMRLDRKLITGEKMELKGLLT